MSKWIEVRRTLRKTGTDPESASDAVAHEEPIGIRINGVDIAVLMRTPGDDFDLVRGFLLTEGIIPSLDSVRRMAYCDRATEESEENLVDVVLDESVAVDVASLQRNLFASSSCGICGKATVENAMKMTTPEWNSCTIAFAELESWHQSLRAGQDAFRRTGGVHGVLWVGQNGETLVREDVGRHNAVDKVIGAAAYENKGDAKGLLVSGRVSFEIIQKAAHARIPIVAAVSAPTSLAVRTADAVGITLIGFARNGNANIYSHEERILE